MVPHPIFLFSIELARANISSQQVAKCQGSDTNNILSNVICRLTEAIKRSRGALHTGRDPANQSLEESSDRRKSRFEVISVLSGFSFLPSHMSPDQLHLQISSGVILQTNEHSLTFLGSIISLWRLESEREKQMTAWTGGKTKQRDRHGYKLRYFSHALVACLSQVKTGKPHEWHLHLCKGLQRCRITLCCLTQKGLQQNHRILEFNELPNK